MTAVGVDGPGCFVNGEGRFVRGPARGLVEAAGEEFPVFVVLLSAVLIVVLDHIEIGGLLDLL